MHFGLKYVYWHVLVNPRKIHLGKSIDRRGGGE